MCDCTEIEYIDTIATEDYITGFNDGYRTAIKETLKDYYEKLCDEIRQSAKEELLNEIKIFYEERKHI